MKFKTLSTTIEKIAIGGSCDIVLPILWIDITFYINA